MSTMQLIEYNGEYYVMPQTRQSQTGFNSSGYWQGNLPSMALAGSSLLGNQRYTDAYYQRMIDSGRMTPFSQMLRPQTQQPIIPTPFAGWGAQPGAGQEAIPVPAAPVMRNPQAAPAPSAPQGQPNTNAGGTNWNLQKINAFQNTGR